MPIWRDINKGAVKMTRIVLVQSFCETYWRPSVRATKKEDELTFFAKGCRSGESERTLQVVPSRERALWTGLSSVVDQVSGVDPKVVEHLKPIGEGEGASARGVGVRAHFRCEQAHVPRHDVRQSKRGRRVGGVKAMVARDGDGDGDGMA
jgi:hypothetical protein